MDKIKKALAENGKYWIAFVGDSITSTEWVHPNWREMVEYVLKEEMCDQFPDYRTSSWGIRCFNFGYDGSTTDDVVKKLDDVKLVSPDLVILMMGLNDPTLGISIKKHRENIEKIVGEFGEKLVISTDIYPNSQQEQESYLPYVEEDIITDYKKAMFINLFEEFKSIDSKKIFTFKLEDGQPDTLHPNQLGNAHIASVILEKVWNIKFDPEKYIKSVNNGDKMPGY